MAFFTFLNFPLEGKGFPHFVELVTKDLKSNHNYLLVVLFPLLNAMFHKVTESSCNVLSCFVVIIERLWKKQVHERTVRTKNKTHDINKVGHFVVWFTLIL